MSPFDSGIDSAYRRNSQKGMSKYGMNVRQRGNDGLVGLLDEKSGTVRDNKSSSKANAQAERLAKTLESIMRDPNASESDRQQAENRYRRVMDTIDPFNAFRALGSTAG